MRGFQQALSVFNQSNVVSFEGIARKLKMRNDCSASNWENVERQNNILVYFAWREIQDEWNFGSSWLQVALHPRNLVVFLTRRIGCSLDIYKLTVVWLDS